MMPVCPLVACLKCPLPCSVILRRMGYRTFRLINVLTVCCFGGGSISGFRRRRGRRQVGDFSFDGSCHVIEVAIAAIRSPVINVAMAIGNPGSSSVFLSSL